VTIQITPEIEYAAAQSGMTAQQYIDKIEAQVEATLNKIPIIDVPSIPPKRRIPQPRFKIEFENVDSLWARVGNTFIWVGPHVFHVEEVKQHKGEFWLLLNDGRGGRFRTPYKLNSNIDLRSPEPQYLNLNDYGACFVTRRPERQFLQGMSRGNMFFKRAGASRMYRMEDMWDLIPGLRDIDNLKWQTSYWELMVKSRALKTLRMSAAIAFYRDKEEKLIAEYRGRPLGYVLDDCVEMDEKDYEKPWIKQDLHEIGCTTRKGDATPKIEATDY
jgi:hypothetical protein